MAVDNDTTDAIDDEDVDVALALMDSAVRNLKAAREMMPQNPHIMFPDETYSLSIVLDDVSEVRRQLTLRQMGHDDYDVSELEHILERAVGEPDDK